MIRLAQARRIALAAQGFGRPRPARVGVRHLQRVVDDVAQFQIDSISVAVRAQYMPAFARLGPYDPALLDGMAGSAPRRLFEYWGHAASLIDVSLQPALRLRMRRATLEKWTSVAEILAEKPDFVDRVLADVAQSGPLTARDIDNVEERARDHWGWNWSQAKHVLEYLFDTGVISVAGRNSAFERRYDLAERVLPAAVLAEPDLDSEAAYEQLVRRAARALGVADLLALSEYFYLRQASVLAAVERVVASGELEPVSVEGLPQQFWRWHGARTPRRITGQALVSPFDSLVFGRRRLEQLFGTYYRIEIYTPAAKRQYGYYVYLFLLDEQFAARVDLKADRRAGVLWVRSAWLEPGADAARTAERLASELGVMAEWLGLHRVAVADVGTLAGRLTSEVTRRG